MSGNSAPNSPMAMLNIGSSHENEVGGSPASLEQKNLWTLIPVPLANSVYKHQICQIIIKRYDMITFLYKITRIKH